MESASKKRGRPSKFTQEEVTALRRRYPWVDERQRQNLFYAEKAKWVLNRLIETHVEEDTEEGRNRLETFDWILQRPSILAELGRMLGKDWEPRKVKESKEMQEAWHSFGQAVGWLGGGKPNTKQAIAVLRRKRTGESRPADAQDLAHQIAVMMIDYLMTHDCDDNRFITRTLNMVQGTIAEILANRKGA